MGGRIGSGQWPAGVRFLPSAGLPDRRARSVFGSAPGVVTPAPPNASSGDGCALARNTVSQTPPPACRVQDAELFRGGAASAGGAALSAASRTVSTSASPRTVLQPFAEPGRAGCAAVGRTGHSPKSPARPASAPWQAPTAWFLCLFNGVTVRLAAGYFCECRTRSFAWLCGFVPLCETN